jgi:cytochrome c553
MEYSDGGLPIFPDNTILAKTFYYNKNENDLTQGKIIIETRVLIKKAGIWEIGNYIWNEEQTDAIRDEAGITKTVNWVDANGTNQTVDYKVPDYATCVMCHNINGVRVPIGPKIRNLNKANQLQHFIDNGILTGINDLSAINKLPNWEDTSYTIDERARAYLDINCAHCHQPGGYYNLTFHNDSFEFRFETRFSDTHIFDKRDSMLTRIESNIEGYKMPFVGTSVKHTEGVSLLNDYLNSL